MTLKGPYQSPIPESGCPIPESPPLTPQPEPLSSPCLHGLLLLLPVTALFFSTKHANPGLAAFFLNNAVKHGNVCWVRRLKRLTSSPVFNLPPPSSPCTRRMQAASTVSVSLITASACRADKATPVAAAAYALATAAVRDGCSFASAVAASQMQGEGHTGLLQLQVCPCCSRH